MPDNGWPNLASALRQYIQSNELSDEFKIPTLESVGFLCEMLDSESVSEVDINHFLTIIVGSMDKSNSAPLRKAATKALFNTLEFIDANMNKESEQKKIIETICIAAVDPDDLEIRKVAFDCMAKIASLYYEILNKYMQHFFQLTTTAISKDNEQVALSAIEFWSAVCDHEIYLNEEFPELQNQNNNNNGDNKNVSQFYIRNAAKQLVPLIQESCLIKQDENAESGEWNISLAGGACLCLIAECIGDDVLPYCLQYIGKNISDMNNWRSREAAAICFGSILVGPNTESLREFVNQAMKYLVGLLSPKNEKNVMVRVSIAWCIGLLCEFHIQLIEPNIKDVLRSVVAGLEDVPVVAVKNVFALQQLANSFGLRNKNFENNNNNLMNQQNPLSMFFEPLVGKIVACAEREDANLCNLRSDCFEALCSLVEASTAADKPVVDQLLKYCCNKLSTAINSKIENADQKETVYSFITCTCQTILAITQKLGDNINSSDYGGAIVDLLMNVIETKIPLAQSDALVVIGSTCDLMGMAFEPKLKDFVPLLLLGLSNVGSSEICKASALVVGDLCRALEYKIKPYAENFIQLLLLNLSNLDLDRMAKPPTIAAIGDVIEAIGFESERYIPKIMEILIDASKYSPNIIDYEEDEDLIEYVNELREAILACYTSIIQSLTPPPDQNNNNANINKAQLLMPYYEPMLRFIMLITTEAQLPEQIIWTDTKKAALGVMGDLISALGPTVANPIRGAKPFVNLIQEATSSRDSGLCDIGKWVKELLTN